MPKVRIEKRLNFRTGKKYHVMSWIDDKEMSTVDVRVPDSKVKELRKIGVPFTDTTR